MNVYNRWMVESYYGIKVYWDGNFLSSRRSGSHFPPYMTDGLPPIHLEGVVWYIEGEGEWGDRREGESREVKRGEVLEQKDTQFFCRMEGGSNFMRTKDPESWRHAILYISQRLHRNKKRVQKIEKARKLER